VRENDEPHRQVGVVACEGGGVAASPDLGGPFRPFDLRWAARVRPDAPGPVARAWGDNAFGKLGDDTTAQRNKQVPVDTVDGALTGTLTNVTSMEGGQNHSLALKGDGTVYAWGHNGSGQLGNGTSGDGTDSDTPVQVEDPSDPTSFLTGVIDVAAGSNHSLALKSDGTVYAWGRNFNGQLGYDPDPSTPSAVENQSDIPMQVSGLTDVTDVAAGMDHSLAVKDDGTTKTVWAWGLNTYGQLGNGASGTATDVNHVPAQVVDVGGSGSLTGVTSVAGGGLHSLALKGDGTVYAWGYNGSGALGDGTSTSPRTTPVQVQTRNQSGTLVPLADVTSVAAGTEHSLALKSSGGTVWAWGNNNRGQLGLGFTGSTLVNTARQVVNGNGPGFLTGVTDVAAGAEHSLAVVGPHGTVWTWGRNDFGQLGNGTTSSLTIPQPRPVQAIQLISATEVAGGDLHSLAVADADTTPPDTTITEAPPANSNSSSGTFEFSSNELDSTFSCRRYIVGNTAPPFSNCDTPITYNFLVDNQHTFDVRAKDVAGNLATTPASYTWRVDTVEPNGFVNINNGDRYTKSATVNLTLSAIDQSPSSGVAEMRFSNDGTNWSNWEPFAASKSWTLSSGDGEKTVHVQFKDAAGNESGTSQSSIVLDTTGPTLDTDNSDGSDGVTPNNGARNVSRRTNVIATFTESFEMKPATLVTNSTVQAPGAFTLVNSKTGAAVNATVSCDDPCKTVTLDPSARLAKRTTYRATITTAAEDLAGNPLVAEKSWTFKTKRR